MAKASAVTFGSHNEPTKDSQTQSLIHMFCIGYYCQTQTTINTWNITGMLILLRPITRKMEHARKPQNHKLTTQ